MNGISVRCFDMCDPPLQSSELCERRNMTRALTTLSGLPDRPPPPHSKG